MFRCILICSAIAAVSMISTDTAVAQRGPWRVNQAFRKLGGGWSGGYHWRTPAYKVDYYNPYSNHNSLLRTGVIPQGSFSYLARIGNGIHAVDSQSINAFDEMGGFSPYHGMAPAQQETVPPKESDVEPGAVEESSTPSVDYRVGPENPQQNDKSILSQPDSPKQPPAVNEQPSPSDQPAGEDGDTGLWHQFDELESFEAPPLSGKGR